MEKRMETTILSGLSCAGLRCKVWSSGIRIYVPKAGSRLLERRVFQSVGAMAQVAQLQSPM